MTGVAARAAAGPIARARRHTRERRRERKGIAGEGRGREAGAGRHFRYRRGRGGAQPTQDAARDDLDRMAKQGRPISDRVAVCGPPGRPYRSHSVQAAGGGILRSLARRWRVPSSITTYRWPVTRTSPAGLGWPGPRKGGPGHRPGPSAVAAEGEERD